jgi:hypothetical protein
MVIIMVTFRSSLISGPAMKRVKEQEDANEYDRSILLLHMARI